MPRAPRPLARPARIRRRLAAIPAAALVFGLASVPALAPAAPATPGRPVQDDLRTVAEASGFTETSTSSEVERLAERIAATSPFVTLGSMGTTVEGRPIPLAAVADPPIPIGPDGRLEPPGPDDDRAIVLIFANIHAGEVAGKEACLMLLRELAAGDDGDPARPHEWLEDLVILLCPNYNADGNDRMAPDNRPGQVGPERMGQRPNAQGLDLNRDYVKLEAPETRALVELLTRWDPHLTVDCHTTNGSAHRMTLTYDVPLHPSTDPMIDEYLRDRMLPRVTERLAEGDPSGRSWLTSYYGNFDRDKTVWRTYGADPRYGANYQGLRGQMQILAEAYSYAPYEDRVRCTLDFLRAILEQSARDRTKLRQIRREVTDRTVTAGVDPQPTDQVALRSRIAALPRPIDVPGWADDRDPDAGPATHRVIHLGRFVPTRTIGRPVGYLLAPGLEEVVEVLEAHGLRTEPIAGTVIAERMVVEDVRRPRRPFQGHHLNEVEVRTEVRRVDLAGGWTLVRTAQPLGTLLVVLLEPECDDGLVAWNFLDADLREGATLPVMRVRRAIDLEPAPVN